LIENAKGKLYAFLIIEINPRFDFDFNLLKLKIGIRSKESS